MTAVKAGDIDRALKSRSAAVCLLLFYGPDAGRVSERARAVADASVQDPADPFSLVRLDGDDVADQPGKLMEEASTFGLFGGRRTIWVRPTSRSIVAAVTACLESAPPDTLIVVEAGDLARTSPLRTTCERSTRALALPCYGDQGRDLATIVNDALAAEGMGIDPDARSLLIDSLGGDRLSTRGEIAKLALYARGRARVTTADVEAVVSDVSSTDLDAAIDAAFLARWVDLGASLTRLEADGTNGAAILAAALRHALALLAGRAARDQGDDADTALRRFRGLHFRRRDGVAQQLATWSHASLAAAVSDLQLATWQSRRHAGLTSSLAGAALFRVAERGRRRA